jgi:hypothetical protein
LVKEVVSVLIQLTKLLLIFVRIRLALSLRSRSKKNSRNKAFTQKKT